MLGQTIYGFDSFEGLPEDWFTASTDFNEGSLRQGKIPEVRKNVELVVGLFDATLTDFLEAHKENVAFMHIDCDLYSSTK
ncbi:hypothetical protein [Butyrivibrio sp. AE3004]|uniref:hypothetical protein n=1 Tax=Butyrivibrio sp. AE3004 TaxID=1506994 RepID=UPI00068F4C17|nr:hypothetical protein [Butyrivibrio sp. AE3004]